MYKKIGLTLGVLLISGFLLKSFIKEDSQVIVKEKKELPLYMEITASYDSIYDNANTTELENRSDIILVGKVKSIDGVINYSEELEEYIMTSTVGTIETQSIIKSDNKISENSEFSFIRVGGTISVAEYEKSLAPRQIIRQGIDKLSQEEKESMYIKFAYEDDIEIEEGKSYLMYLKFEEKLNKYRIIGMEYGLKEYKASTREVKNNQNQNWEKIGYNF